MIILRPCKMMQGTKEIPRKRALKIRGEGKGSSDSKVEESRLWFKFKAILHLTMTEGFILLSSTGIPLSCLERSTGIEKPRNIVPLV